MPVLPAHRWRWQGRAGVHGATTTMGGSRPALPSFRHPACFRARRSACRRLPPPTPCGTARGEEERRHVHSITPVIQSGGHDSEIECTGGGSEVAPKHPAHPFLPPPVRTVGARLGRQVAVIAPCLRFLGIERAAGR